MVWVSEIESLNKGAQVRCLLCNGLGGKACDLILEILFNLVREACVT